MKSIPINKKKLIELNRLLRHYDVNPIFLNHHLDKNSKNPIDKIGVELQKEVIDSLSISSEEEINELVSILPRYLQSIVIRNTGEKYDFEILSFSYLIFELLKFKFSFKKIINFDYTESEILKIYPELKTLLDEDNLLLIDERFQWTFDGLIYKNHVLFFHQFLRRGYLGKLNVNFIKPFELYYHKTKQSNKFKIAIDHTRIATTEFYQKTLELDTWYGCAFIPKEIDNPKHTGLTIIKRSEYYPFDPSYTLDRTEFLWTIKGNLKTLQIEEVSNESNNYDYLYFNKYIHSQRDIALKKIIHFDGAVKVYLEQDYNKRFLSNLGQESKSHKKIKLFRIDGDIDVQYWTELISNFYKGNEMIIEYFDPQEYETLFGEEIRTYKQQTEDENNRH